jgi:pimeloyl-ACP methyl ester carboxylesterase
MITVFLSIISILFADAFAQGKPLVVYIGGAKSTDSQMRCWEKGARENSAGSKFEFKAYAYPSGVTLNHGSDKQPNGMALVSRISEELAKTAAGRPLIIVGHSSGSDLANALAVKTHQQKLKVHKLVNLDGYGIPGSVPSEIPATCVTAKGTNAKGQTVHSLYWKEAHSACSGRRLMIKEYSGCGDSKMCLHFRMTNRAVSSKLNLKNYGTGGYSGCATNLDWLEAPAPAIQHSEADATEATT